jgi:hypothetical protein
VGEDILNQILPNKSKILFIIINQITIYL